MRSTMFLLAVLLCVVFTAAVRAQLPNAWQINDNSTAAGSTLTYATNLTTAQFDAATNNGWRFTITSRLLTNYGGAHGSMYVLFDYGNVRFGYNLNLDASNRLVVTPLGALPITLTTDASSATNYHTHELDFNPATQQVTYRFDGVALTNWYGQASTGQSHEAVWGSDSSADQDEMNFHRVELSIVGQGVVASYDAGFAGNPAVAPSPTTQGWARGSGNVAIPEGPVSPDVLPLPPLVTTLAASGIQPNSATLNAQLHPDGLATGCYFEYGFTTNYGNFTPTNMVPGDNFSTNVSSGISGLSGGATYHFRALITNHYGAVTGADLSFTTLAYITTQPATALVPNSATLNASINTYGLDTAYYWKYGTTTNYGSFTSTNTVSAGAGATNVNFGISGLSPATTYHFRAVATNSSGIETGDDLSFTTPADVTTLPASDLTPSTATLNASLHPYGQGLAYYWEYGTTTNYGNVTPTNTLSGSVVATNVSAPIGGLSPGTTYHFRCEAANVAGLAYGQDLAFVTPQLFLVTNLADSGAGSLRQAIADAGSGAFIEFTVPGVIALTGGQLTIGHNLTIDASSLAGGVTIDAGNRSPILNITGGNVTLVGLVLTNGYTGSSSGGGGISVSSGAVLTLNHCSIADCSAPNGVGGAFDNSGVLTLNDCTLSGNSASVAGALNNLLTATINDSTLSGNSATSGALGGAIWNEAGGVLTMNNSTLAGNTSTGYGGAIYSSGGPLTLNNCTVSANFSDLGAAIAIHALINNPLILTNTIVAGNTAASGPANVAGVLGGGIGGVITNSIIGGNPELAPLGDYGGPTETMPPLAGSPAIDAGLDSVTNFLPTDQRGQARRFGSYVDIGAVEFRSFVVLNTNDSGPGSLRGTLPETPDQITFASPLAGQTILLTSGDITFSRGLTIDASSLPGGITLSANHSSRLLEIGPHVNLFLNSLTLRDGVAPGGSYPTNCGGSVLNFGRLTLDNCTVQNDQAVNGANSGGGGIENDGAIFSASNCLFTANSATSGGGIRSDNGSQVTLNQCTFSSSSAGNTGGAIQNNGSSSVINDSTFSGNSAGSTGGAIQNDGSSSVINDSILFDNSALAGDGGAIDNDSGGTLTLSRSTLYANSAAAGGAIENFNGTLAANDSTVSGNSVTNNGGGIDNQNGSPLVANNCTVYGNSAGAGGGGINNYGALALTNTLVAGNTAATDPNLHLDISGSFTGAHNIGSGDPFLAPLGDYGGPAPTMPPLAGSPVIDAGNDSVTNFLTSDQRGYPRLSGAHVDIGAVEAQYAPTNSAPQLAGSAFSAAGGTSTFQFTFTSSANADFTVLASTNVALPLTNWVEIGSAAQSPPGQYQFTDPGVTNYPQRFYRVVSP